MDSVELFYGVKKIAFHQRFFGNNKWQLDPHHYLELIRQRPQAFDSARPISQWRNMWPKCLEALLERFQQKQGDNKGIKEFIRVLMLFKENPAAEVVDAVKCALAANVSSGEAVIHILKNGREKTEDIIEPLDNWLRFAPADVSIRSDRR